MRKNDNRCKLTPQQVNEILAIPLKPGRFNGMTEIAEKYGVSKRTIQFIFHPDRLVKNRELAKKRKEKLG
jgi:hypothetical protein|tara:strand:- start:11007 stop:11216 length:210 start_codon:yes stop_codon:yes gene_type:complete